MMMFLQRLSFRAQLLFSLSGIIFIIGGLSVYFLGSHFEKNQMEEQIAIVYDNIDNFEQMNKVNIKLYDFHEIYRSVERFKFHPAAVYVGLEDIANKTNIYEKYFRNNVKLILYLENDAKVSENKIRGHAVRTFNYSGHRFIYISKNMGDANNPELINFRIILDSGEISGIAHQQNMFLFGMWALSILLMYLLILFVSRKITMPLNDFGSHLLNADLTPMRIDGRNSLPHDIKKLIDHYNMMIEKIHGYENNAKRQAALAAIGRSAAMVAHDVRKPIASMKALLSSLPVIKDDPEQLKKMVTNVDRSISQTNTLLNDILEFSRDSTSLNLSEVNTQGIIISALSDALRNRKDASVRISYDLKHSHVLHVDSNRIVRVLINIMDNALDAMELNHDGKSAGLLQIGTKEIEREGKRFIAISVIDEGPGLSKEALVKIFDPFFTQGKVGGTGLGLAICHKIISMHGGRIEAGNRTDGNGALFTIELLAGEKRIEINEAKLIHNSSELKLFREEEAVRVEYGDTANTSGFMRINKEKGRPSYLLIVDDEPLFRESVRCLLNELGQVKDHVKVVEADSAEKALTLFRSLEFDYVITDIDLGKMRINGYEFAHLILDKYPDVHVLIHSNKRKDEMDKNVRQIASNRFMGFLPKPMRASELLQFLACKTFETCLSQDQKVEPKKKVLVLNDDEIQLMSYRFQISSPIVQVFTSTSVSDAMRIYTEQGADLILSDINLGNDEPSGYDFLRCVRERDRDIPFYFVSGYSRQEEEPKAKEQGATGYFQIPVKDDDLRRILS